MNEKEQIEELAEVISVHFQSELDLTNDIYNIAESLYKAGYRKQSDTVKEKGVGKMKHLDNDNRSCKACGDNIIRDFDKEIPTLREKNSYLITDEGKVKLCFLEKLGKNEEGSILYISDINYCPNCGRKLADNGKE